MARQLDTLHQLPPDLLRSLREALDFGGRTHDLFSVEQDVLSGRAQLWVSDGGNAAVVTEIVQHDLGPVTLHFWLAGGHIDGVMAIHDYVTSLAKEELGAEAVTLTGRRGWVRQLRAQGWRETAVLMHREL